MPDGLVPAREQPGAEIVAYLPAKGPPFLKARKDSWAGPAASLRFAGESSEEGAPCGQTYGGGAEPTGRHPPVFDGASAPASF
jgi:hypothetical protein